jgi:hypothetical protein
MFEMLRHKLSLGDVSFFTFSWKEKRIQLENKYFSHIIVCTICKLTHSSGVADDASACSGTFYCPPK